MFVDLRLNKLGLNPCESKRTWLKVGIVDEVLGVSGFQFWPLTEKAHALSYKPFNNVDLQSKSKATVEIGSRGSRGSST